MTAGEIAAALGGKKHGTYWLCRCPAHADKTPSLSISEGEGGKVLFKCHAGCTQDAVLDAVRSRGLFGAESPSPGYQERKRGNGATRPETALVHSRFGVPHIVHEYFDAANKLVGVVCRWDWPPDPAEINPAKRKNILPAVPSGVGWLWRAMEAPRPLYGLPALLAEPSKPVLVVEGEKTADAARELIDGWLVVTWAGGSSAVSQTDWTPLAGRQVTIWPDNDKPGTEAAEAIAKILPQAKIVDTAGFGPSWDLADWTSGDPEPMEMIEKAKSAAVLKTTTLPLKRFSMTVIKDFPPPIWAIPGLVPEGLTILAGSKARGKSFLCLDFAIARAGGMMALGNIQCEPAPTLYLALEDTEARIKERGLAILQGRAAPENLEIATEWKTAAAGGLEDIATWCQAREGAGFVIIDILARIRDAPSGREKGVYQTEYDMIAAIKAVSIEHRVPVLVTHHSNKGDAADPVMRVSGTQGLTGAADTVIVLQREANDPHGTLSIRGRDIAESEIALEFDKDTGRATKLGSANDFRKSEERREIIRAISDQAMTPKEIADYTRMKPVNVRMLLAKMLKAGEILRFQDGSYKA